MNELNELEKWLVTLIENNKVLYEYAVAVNNREAMLYSSSRGDTFDFVLHKIHAIQRAQERSKK